MENELITEVDLTIEYTAKNGEVTTSVQPLYFDADDDPLTEKEVYELGFCGDIAIEDENGNEIELSLDAGPAEYLEGQSVIDSLSFNLSHLGKHDLVDFAKVVNFELHRQN